MRRDRSSRQFAGPIDMAGNPIINIGASPGGNSPIIRNDLKKIIFSSNDSDILNITDEWKDIPIFAKTQATSEEFQIINPTQTSNFGGFAYLLSGNHFELFFNESATYQVYYSITLVPTSGNSGTMSKVRLLWKSTTQSNYAPIDEAIKPGFHFNLTQGENAIDFLLPIAIPSGTSIKMQAIKAQGGMTLSIPKYQGSIYIKKMF